MSCSTVKSLSQCSGIQCHANLKQAAVRDGPVLPVLAGKAPHVAIDVLQEEAAHCQLAAVVLVRVSKQLDEGDDVGGVDAVGLLHQASHSRIHLYHL